MIPILAVRLANLMAEESFAICNGSVAEIAESSGARGSTFELGDSLAAGLGAIFVIDQDPAPHLDSMAKSLRPGGRLLVTLRNVSDPDETALAAALTGADLEWAALEASDEAGHLLFVGQRAE